MSRTLRTLLSVAVVAAGAALLPITGALYADSIKLSGCLVRGEGDGAGYLLINVPNEPAGTSTSSAPVSPGAVGTSGTFANIFYWLDGSGDLKAHVGHQVEVDGDRKGDVKDGELKIDRKDDWTEMEIKSDGRTMRAKVPNSSVVAGPSPDHKLDVLVRRVNVEHVHMVSAACK